MHKESSTEVLSLSGNMAFRVQYHVGTGAWREKGNGNQSRIPSHNPGIHLFRMRQAHRKYERSCHHELHFRYGGRSLEEEISVPRVLK